MQLIILQFDLKTEEILLIIMKSRGRILKSCYTRWRNKTGVESEWGLGMLSQCVTSWICPLSVSPLTVQFPKTTNHEQVRKVYSIWSVISTWSGTKRKKHGHMPWLLIVLDNRRMFSLNCMTRFRQPVMDLKGWWLWTWSVNEMTASRTDGSSLHCCVQYASLPLAYVDKALHPWVNWIIASTSVD